MKAALATSVTAPLSDIKLADIQSLGIPESFGKDQLIFTEGDPADTFYYIEKGSVSVTIDKILSTNKRNASVTALEETEVLSVDKRKFLEFMQSHPEISEKIFNKLSMRNEELSLKEQLINSMGIAVDNLHVSIKGDPSLRETTFSRERYTSVVDPILSSLQESMKELLLNRSVYRLFLGFNNGEVRVSSVFDPLSTEIHTARKLTDRGYLDRHFPPISYEDKTNLIRGMYSYIASDRNFTNLPKNWKNILSVSHQQWQPVSSDEISNVISKLTDLRAIPNFYVRNVSISIVQDAIRMQFNCDGTHIVSAESYKRFLEENLEAS
jgi:hypothetical protein